MEVLFSSYLFGTARQECSKTKLWIVILNIECHQVTYVYAYMTTYIENVRLMRKKNCKTKILSLITCILITIA